MYFRSSSLAVTKVRRAILSGHQPTESALMLVAVPTLPRRLDFGQGVPPSAATYLRCHSHNIGCI
jgi:hypothetical protein